ncbi:MAG: FAD-dependent oxidoreductase, partial [Thermoleophilia bacterium]|nr:FAD-dependent oxidoreductase [Thermoleophilia bacterium]
MHGPVKNADAAPFRAANERLPEVVDAVVIGAGAGGLAAAAHLAMAGRRVLVMEQDRHVGGTAHVFRRGGFVFPAGPLSFTVPEYLAGTLRDLGVTASLHFERDIFQVVRGGLDVIISVPLARVAAQLEAAFPAEREGIRTVTGVLREVIAALRHLQPEDLIEGDSAPGSEPAPGFAAGAASPPATESRRLAFAVLRRWEAVPARELIDRHLSDQRLRDLLGSQGATETVMPVVLLAQMWDFMAERGIWYPPAGIGTVGDLLAERVVELGGIVTLGRRVARITIEKGRAAGVVVEGGAVVRAPVIISGADYRHTMSDLLPGGAAAEAAAAEAAGRPALLLTSSNFSVFLGVRRDSVDLGAFRGHQLLVKLEEGALIPWAEKRPRVEDLRADEIWLCWWSRHQGPVPLAPPGCEALVLKVMAPFAPFAPLDGGGRGRHAQGYYARKESMADALVAAASEVVPGLSEAVVVR